MSCRLGSYLESQNPKVSFGSGPPALRRRPRLHGSTEAPQTFAKARRHPRLQNPRTNLKGLSPRSRNHRKYKEGFFRTHHKKEEEGRPEHFISGTRQTPNESTRTVLLRGTELPTARRPTGARNGGKEEDGKRRGEGGLGPSPIRGQEGEGREGKGLKKAP